MSHNHKKRIPPIPHRNIRSGNRRFMPILAQSLFARARRFRQSKLGNPMRMADVAKMLRRVSGQTADIRNDEVVKYSEVLFEALEPRILLSADGLMPPPTDDMFNENPPEEEVILPPSELDEEVAEQLPPDEVGTLNPEDQLISGPLTETASASNAQESNESTAEMIGGDESVEQDIEGG